MFSISLWVCSLWICSSKNIVSIYKVSFQNIEESFGGTFFSFFLTSGGKGEANETQKSKIPILSSIEKLG